MREILFVLLGMLIWQVVTTLVVLFTDNEEAGLYTGCGLTGLLMVAINTIVYRIRLTYRHHKFAAALEDNKGNLWYCKSCDVENIISASDGKMQWADWLKDCYKPSDGWDLSTCMDKNTINIRYCPMCILKSEGFKKWKG